MGNNSWTQEGDRSRVCWIVIFSWKFMRNLQEVNNTKREISCCRTAVGVGQRALSLSAHTAGGPPPSWPRGGGWRHHAIFLEYSWDYCNVAATGNGWFLPSEREPQPLPSHRRSSSRALFPRPPSPVVWVAWITERGGADIVRHRLWIRHSAATPTRGSNGYAPRIWLRWYVKFRLFLRAGTGRYGQLAWPWTLTSPSLRQRCFC